MAIKIDLSPRLRYIFIASVTLIPLISVMALVLLSTYLPVFRIMDNIVYESMEEMMPLVQLENRLHRAVMPPNDYLIHKDPQEIENWQQLIVDVDEQFVLVQKKVRFEKEMVFLTQLRREWEKRKAEGWLIINNPDRLSATDLSHVMEEFDANMYDLIDDIEGQHAEMYEFIHHEYMKANLQKERALIISVLMLFISLGTGFAASMYLNRDREKLIKESEQDPLTGVYNRRGFQAKIASMERHTLLLQKTHYSLVMLDIDHFKSINDRFGHDTGDRVICHISKLASDAMRNDDFLARWGGEEFVMLLPNTEKRTAVRVAERIREVISSHPIVVEDKEVAITVSLGVSSYPENGNKSDEVLSAADGALYRAKEGGRNCVVTG